MFVEQSCCHKLDRYVHMRVRNMMQDMNDKGNTDWLMWPKKDANSECAPDSRYCVISPSVTI